MPVLHVTGFDLNDPQFDEAKANEVRQLLQKGTTVHCRVSI